MPSLEDGDGERQGEQEGSPDADRRIRQRHERTHADAEDAGMLGRVARCPGLDAQDLIAPKDQRRTGQEDDQEHAGGLSRGLRDASL